MAVAFEGFSIREYAAKMRSVDVVKCWPFSEELLKKREAVEELLPPIAVAKYKWWSHELKLLRSDQTNIDDKESSRNEKLVVVVEGKQAGEKLEEKSEMVCPVCRVFVAATVNAVNAHIDDCLAQASKEERRQMKKAMKAKSKAPKKRSITEIFAVAPQIDTIEEDFSDGNEGSEEGANEKDEDEDANNDDELADDFNVLSVSTSSNAASQIMKNKKKTTKKKKKENKRAYEEINNRKLNSKKKKMKMMMKKKKRKNNVGSITKKGDTHIFKLQNPVNFAKKLTKRFAVDILKTAPVCENKHTLKCLSKHKMQKAVETSKLVKQSQEPVFPIRSILKNHAICGQNTNMQCDTQANSCCIQQSERHVRFSGKDDILSPRKKDFFPSEQSTDNSLSDAFATSSEKVQCTDKTVAAMEVNGSDDDVSIRMDYETQIHTVTGRKQPDISEDVDIPSSLRPHVTNQGKVKHFAKKTVAQSQGPIDDNNFQRYDQGCPIASHRSGFTGIPGFLSELEGPCINTQVGSNISRTFNSRGKLANHVLDPSHRVSEIASIVNTRAFPEPSSCFTLNENANCQRLQLQSQSAVEKINGQTLQYQPFRCPSPNDQSFQYQPFRCPSPMDLMGGISPFPEWKHNTFSWREKCMDQDFFGLPLNSQGELIQSSSRGKGAVNQLRETNTVAGSPSSFPACGISQHRSTRDYLSLNNKHFVVRELPIMVRELPNDHLNLFPVQNYVHENPTLHIPARLGVTYLESTGRADNHQLDYERGSDRTFQPVGSDLNLMNMSFSGSRQYDLMEKQKPNGTLHPKETSSKMVSNTSQPTMRLMGKDVAIGKSSKEMQGYEDEKVWTDKEMITEHCQSNTSLDNSSLNRTFQHEWFPQTVSGKSKESIAPCLELSSGQAPQSNILMTSPGTSFPHPYLNWQTNASFPSSSLASTASPSSNLLPFTQIPTSHTMLNQASNLQELFISGAESIRLGSQLPVLATPQDTCEHVHWRPSELPYKQNLPHFTKPGFDFPFVDPDSRVNAQSSWFQSCTKSLPSWLLHATQQGNTPIISSQSFSSVGSKHHQHISSGTNILNNPSVYHQAEGSYSHNSVPSHSQGKSALGPSPIVLPPLVPVIPGAKQASSINVAYRNRMKVKDRLKSKALGVKDLYPCKKSKKRQAHKALDSIKSSRILDQEAKLSARSGSIIENLSNEMQYNWRAHDPDSNRSRGSINGIITSDNESPKVDYMARSGPIKLSAGAKHILKPNQNMDQDNSRPIHSTIPFASVTNGSRAPEYQNKATKIYRF
nr:uncharacterized protein LOC107405635 [Ziziphus jujuba var. spinosa]